MSRESNYNHIKVIGFDLDQTLYPKSPLIDEVIQNYLYKAIAHERKVSLMEAKQLFSDIYKNGHGKSGRATLIQLGVPNAAELVQEALESELILPFLIEDIATTKLIEQISHTYRKLDLITGSSKALARNKLNRLNIPTSLFSHIIADEQASKSNGDAYRMWLGFYPNIEPNKFLYIGDRANSDFVVPSGLGIQSILVNINKPDETLACPQYRSFLDIRDILL